MKRFIIILLFLLLLCIATFAQTDEVKADKSNCGKIQLNTPASSLNSGEMGTFTIKFFENINGKSPSIKWSVDKGRIISGQGTSSMTVDTTGLYGEVLTTVVRVDRSKDCSLLATGTAEIQGGHGFVFDEFGKLEVNELKRKFNLLIEELKSSPTNSFILNYGTKVDIEKRNKILRNFIKESGFSEKRFIFVEGGEEKDIKTRFWLVPNGCPSASIAGLSRSINVNEKRKFNLNIFGGKYDADNIKIKWTVEGAEIISGQGTQTLEVLTYKKYIDGMLVEATAEVSGLPKNCKDLKISRAISCDHCGGIGTKPYLFDEFENLKNGDIKARTDALMFELQNNEGSRGFIINYGSRRQIVKLERFIRSFMNLRTYELERIVFIYGGREKGIRSRFWIVPAGADESTID